jgi:hypothetical protein
MPNNFATQLRLASAMMRRARRYSSEEVNRALFRKKPRRYSLAELKEGIRRAIRNRHARR